MIHWFLNLGIIFDPHFSFSVHDIVLKINKCFENVNTLKIIYFSVVSWNIILLIEHHFIIRIDGIEMVQKKFIKTINYRQTLLDVYYNICLMKYRIMS